jgi:CMP-N-acetylneuraminic acid synthetase
MTKILAIIPARAGSKDLPDKNVRLYRGKPLLVWSIEQARQIRLPTRVVVSTDSRDYAQLALQAGAEVPFLRPPELAGDLSTDLEVFAHALDWFRRNEQYCPDLILHLRPTYPNRTVELINKALDRFLALGKECTSLRTVVEVTKTPFKMYTVEDGRLIPLFSHYKGIQEPYNACRQRLPQCYLHNGCVDIFWSDLISQGTVTGDRIYPYIMDSSESNDIDSQQDWDRSEGSFEAGRPNPWPALRPKRVSDRSGAA